VGVLWNLIHVENDLISPRSWRSLVLACGPLVR
jgi:hypothetical protein